MALKVFVFWAGPERASCMGKISFEEDGGKAQARKGEACGTRRRSGCPAVGALPITRTRAEELRMRAASTGSPRPGRAS